MVQIGAYVDPGKLANAAKTQPGGAEQLHADRHRQRPTGHARTHVGPFTSRKQMEQVAAKVRALGLPVSMYQL